MLCNNAPLTVQQFNHNALSPEFPGAVSTLNLLEASGLFREYLKCIQLKICVKSASHYFYCFNGFKSVAMVMCQMGIKPYNPLIVNSTQDILNTNEYLLFQIKYFQRRNI